MSSNNRKIFDNLISRTKIYLVIIFILMSIICVLNTRLIIPSIIIYSLILIYTFWANGKRKSELSEHLQDLTLTVDSAAKNTLINSPFPLVILESDGNIIWKSLKFTQEFSNIDINNYLNDILSEIKIELSKEKTEKKSISRELQIGNKQYKVLGELVKQKNNKKKNNEYMFMLYFLDETENVQIQNEYKASQNCIGIIVIDNYDEIMQRIDADKRPQKLVEIEKIIYEWANETNGIMIKSERDTYICIFEQKYLKKIKESKFEILDLIKEVCAEEKIQLTLSIAISNEGQTGKEKYKSALATMDIVLGRGGDQAAIREKGKYIFYGGRAEEVEKRTKVKARVISQALEELIKESNNIMIMGHINPDIDSIGSSLGLYRLIKTLGKEAKIVTNTDGLTLSKFMENFEKDEQYEDVLIKKEQAIAEINNETLLIIVDTHKKSYVESPELLDKTNKIVIIDHHRRSTDFIENSILTFQEVYASSAAELVTELLQYAQVEVELKPIEAESLYAGIMVDTKNFTFKTGVRTFEAAAYLRKCGIDIIRVKKWFQSDLDSYNKIAEIVKNAEVIRDTIGIALYTVEDKDAGLICAKAADELLTIGDITASFVLGCVGGKVSISGRSIGDINVQVILEKLGGGGHITLAGAQVEGKLVNEVKLMLLEKIDEYFNEIGA